MLKQEFLDKMYRAYRDVDEDFRCCCVALADEVGRDAEMLFTRLFKPRHFKKHHPWFGLTIPHPLTDWMNPNGRPVNQNKRITALAMFEQEVLATQAYRRW